MDSSGNDRFLLIFDVGQTLCYNCETYEEFVHNQATAVYRVFLDRAAVMSPEELARLGLTLLPIQNIVKSREEWEAKFVAGMSKAIFQYRDVKNSKYVGEEVGLNALFARIIAEQDIFGCGITLSNVTEDQVKSLTKFGAEILKDDKCVTAKYAAFEGLKELLARYQADKRYTLAICTNTSYAKKQRAIIRQCDVDRFFDMIVVSSEVGIRKPNPDILGIIKKAYPQFKDYQICMIGDMIDRDVQCGLNANVRTLWFTQNQFDPLVNAKKMKTCQPDFAFSQYAQLPGIVELMERDAEFLKGQSEEVQKGYRKPENYARLPSQNLLRVAYYFPQATEAEMIKHGYAISNDKVLYYPLQMNCSFELQGRFQVLLHNATDAYLASDKQFSGLCEYLRANKSSILAVNPLESTEMSSNKAKMLAQLEAALKSPALQGTLLKLAVRSMPYVALSNSSPDPAYPKIVAGMKGTFPLAVAKSLEPQSETLVSDEAGLRLLLEKHEWKGKEVLAHPFFRHGGRRYKVECIGRHHVEIVAKGSSGAGTVTHEKGPEFEGMKELARSIGTQLGIAVYSVDLMAEEGTGAYYVMGVNLVGKGEFEGEAAQERLENYMISEYRQLVTPVVVSSR